MTFVHHEYIGEPVTGEWEGRQLPGGFIRSSDVIYADTVVLQWSYWWMNTWPDGKEYTPVVNLCNLFIGHIG